MSNILTPMDTNLPASGKLVSLSGSIEFDVDAHGAGRQALVDWVSASVGFNNMLTYQLDVGATETDFNLWEATSIDGGARAVAIMCVYGGGAVAINAGKTPTGFPMTAATNANSWLIYSNPSGGELTIGVDNTGPGIQKISVDTEVESRFLVLIFL